MPEEVVLACEPACAINAPIVIAEESMLCWFVDPLMSSQIFRCDESFATDGAELCFGAVPASVVAVRMSAGCTQSSPELDRQATYSFSDFEAKVLPQPWQDSEVDDPA